MIKIDVIHLGDKSNFPVNSVKLAKKLTEFLSGRKVKNTSLIVGITSESEMLRLGKIYLKETDNKIHNVLSFPESETRGEFVYPPKFGKRLGEIYVCYQKACEEAAAEGINAEDKIYELTEHGALHLLGIHHK